MDIFTHVMIGAAATSPFWHSHPLESVMFTFGSVLPDVDALSRQLGKVAFLRFHQGWTHSLPLIVAATFLFAALVWWSGYGLFVPSIFACGLGAFIHVLTDFSNTFGVRLLAPFDMRRHSLEWVFFIDAPFIAATVVTLFAQALWVDDAVRVVVGASWLCGSVTYFLLRGWLRQRAGTLVPDAVSLIPSAFFPWRFEGLTLCEGEAETYDVDVLRGEKSAEERRPVFHRPELEQLPEYQVMQELSVGYAPIRVEADEIECADLRTRRTFGTQFGRLLVRSGEVIRFDV